MENSLRLGDVDRRVHVGDVVEVLDGLVGELADDLVGDIPSGKKYDFVRSEVRASVALFRARLLGELVDYVD